MTEVYSSPGFPVTQQRNSSEYFSTFPVYLADSEYRCHIFSLNRIVK